MIYDCFVFYDELDLLEIRLNVLDKVVDKFVIVESRETFAGTPKPLHYHINKERFAKFNDRIISVVIEKFPRFNWKKLRPAGNWDRERFQRNAILQGLTNCKDDDIVILSDVDEIPRPEKVTEYLHSPGIKTFYQELYFYYLNYLVTKHPEPNEIYRDYIPWHGTVMGAFKYFKKSPEDVRTLRNRQDSAHTRVVDAGWHYSFMGGTEMIIKKLKAYPHVEYMGPRVFEPEWIEEQVRAGKDILNRDMTFKLVDIAERGPKYLYENQDRYKHLLL